jgi:hypothetical protein
LSEVRRLFARPGTLAVTAGLLLLGLAIAAACVLRVDVTTRDPGRERAELVEAYRLELEAACTAATLTPEACAAHRVALLAALRAEGLKAAEELERLAAASPEDPRLLELAVALKVLGLAGGRRR